MTKGRKQNQNTKTRLQEFVTVTFAEDMSLARDYTDLLKESGIPATVKKQSLQSSSGQDIENVAVMVPEDYLDEAHVLIESENLRSSFGELSIEDQEDEDLDDFETGFEEDHFEF